MITFILYLGPYMNCGNNCLSIFLPSFFYHLWFVSLSIELDNTLLLLKSLSLYKGQILLRAGSKSVLWNWKALQGCKILQGTFFTQLCHQIFFSLRLSFIVIFYLPCYFLRSFRRWSNDKHDIGWILIFFFSCTGNCWIVRVWTAHWAGYCLLWKGSWLLPKWRSNNLCQLVQAESSTIRHSTRTVSLTTLCKYFTLVTVYAFWLL